MVFGQGLDRLGQPTQPLFTGRALRRSGRRCGGAGNVACDQGGDKGVDLDRTGFAVLPRRLGEEAGGLVALPHVQGRLPGQIKPKGRGLVAGA
jgi:hypothetical protein